MSDFGGSGEFWTSKSSSWRHFAADGRVLRPVRGLEAVARSSGPRTAPRAGPSYARFLVFLEAWILSVWKLRRIEDLCCILHALRPEASADLPSRGPSLKKIKIFRGLDDYKTVRFLEDFLDAFILLQCAIVAIYFEKHYYPTPFVFAVNVA